jgi:hypothetical protein
MRQKARGLARHVGLPGWLEESYPADVILYVMDGPYRLTVCPYSRQELPSVFQLL